MNLEPLEPVGYTVQTPGGKEDFVAQCARSDEAGALMICDRDEDGYLSQPLVIYAPGEWTTCRRLP